MNPLMLCLNGLKQFLFKRSYLSIFKTLESLFRVNNLSIAGVI